jgi:hypothetical protein
MQHRARSIAQLAGALSLGVATVTVGAASAATVPRAAGRVLVRASSSTMRRTPLEVRTVSDGAFRVTRTIERVDGVDHVVFTATNLRTGRGFDLNAAA